MEETTNANGKFVVLILYTSTNIPNCPYCDEARKWLVENKINYIEIDIANNKKLQKKIYQKKKSKNVPVVNIDGSYFRGWFKKSELKEIKEILEKD